MCADDNVEADTVPLDLLDRITPDIGADLHIAEGGCTGLQQQWNETRTGQVRL